MTISESLLFQYCDAARDCDFLQTTTGKAPRSNALKAFRKIDDLQIFAILEYAFLDPLQSGSLAELNVSQFKVVMKGIVFDFLQRRWEYYLFQRRLAEDVLGFVLALSERLQALVQNHGNYGRGAESTA